MGSTYFGEQATTDGPAGEIISYVMSLRSVGHFIGNWSLSTRELFLTLEPKCRKTVQVDLAKASTSQDRLERQLDILQVHQKQISDALAVMEAEAEHLFRYCCTLNQPRPGNAFFADR